jgi:hypothetical protein
MLLVLISGVVTAVSGRPEAGAITFSVLAILRLIPWLKTKKQNTKFYWLLSEPSESFSNFMDSHPEWFREFDTELELKKFRKSEKKQGRKWFMPALSEKNDMWSTYRTDIKKKVVAASIEFANTEEK